MLDHLRPDRPVSRAPRWFAADALLAVLFGYFTVDQVQRAENVAEHGSVDGIGWLLLLAPTALIVVRRFAPAMVLLGALAVYLVAAVDLGEGNAFLAVPPLVYTVAATRSATGSAWLALGAYATLMLTTTYGPGEIDPFDGGITTILAIFVGIGWVIGWQVRAAAMRQSELADQAEVTQDEIDAVARRAVADERTRIARELHDAVGHAVNVMVMQAGAARMSSTDDRSRDTLRDIERVGRSALSDLDRMLGLLHGEEDAAPTEPAYGLADVARLVDDVRAAGADVHLDASEADALDATSERPIGATAYRIVQEALTNAVKHAGRARIEISLATDDDAVVVTVVDDGRGAASAPTSHGGRGRIGMRERVALHRGELTAGPRPGGGFRVEARLPRNGVDA